MVLINLPSSRQSLTVLSPLVEAITFPSGLKATPQTPALCPLRVVNSVPSNRQSLTVLSPLEEAMILPSGLKTTLLISTPPGRVFNKVPSALQSLTDLSALATAIMLLSGLIATPLNAELRPSNRLSNLPFLCQRKTSFPLDETTNP